MAVTPPDKLPPRDPTTYGLPAFQALYGSVPEAMLLGWGLNVGFWNYAALVALRQMNAAQASALVTAAHAAGLGSLPADTSAPWLLDVAYTWLAAQYPDPTPAQIDATQGD